MGRLDALYGATFVEHVGRPGLPTRLMVGLHLLKHIKGLSDEAVCAAWVENPYFQAFCGETHFQHRLPADRSSMTNWRKRMDGDKLEALLAETIAIAMASGAVSERQLERHGRHHRADQGGGPSHRQPSHAARDRVAEPGRRRPWRAVAPVLPARCTPGQEGGGAPLMHGRGHRQAKAHLRFMRTRLGRLIRDIERKIADDPVRMKALENVLERARTIRRARRHPEALCLPCPGGRMHWKGQGPHPIRVRGEGLSRDHQRALQGRPIRARRHVAARQSV